MPDPSPWESRHTESLATGDYPRDPQPFLLAHAADLPPGGRALDIAAGLGRNSFWLANQGFDVTAIDASAVAVSHIQVRASDEHLPIHARPIDLTAQPLPPGPFDLIVSTMFLVRDLAPQIEDRLAPGGILCFVTLLENGSGPPVVHKEYVLRRGELSTLFPNLQTLDVHEDPPAAPRPLAALLARQNPP